MEKTKMISALPYCGIPVIAFCFFLLQRTQMNWFLLLQWEVLLVFGYVIALCDLRTKRIPNQFILAMMATWIVMIFVKLMLDTESALILLQDGLWGFALGGGLFLLVYVISRKGLGGGDVKFMAATGLYLGFAGVLGAMLYGTVLAGICGLTLLLFKKIGKKDTMPLAPFLYVGVVIATFFP